MLQNTIYLHPKGEELTRKVYSMFDMLGDIGGL
jgi:hypothetical protein